MRQQCCNLTRPLRRQARQHNLQVGIRIVPLFRADWIKLMIAAARLPLRSDPGKSQSCAPAPKAVSGFRTNYYQWAHPRHRYPLHEAHIPSDYLKPDAALPISFWSQSAMMRPDSKVEKVYLYPKPVDFRKSIDGLAALVELDIKVAVFDRKRSMNPTYRKVRPSFTVAFPVNSSTATALHK
jgi:hypothetical protein